MAFPWKHEMGRPITDAEWQLIRDVLERAILRDLSRKAPGEKTEGDSGEVPVCAKHNSKILTFSTHRTPISKATKEQDSKKSLMENRK